MTKQYQYRVFVGDFHRYSDLKSVKNFNHLFDSLDDAFEFVKSHSEGDFINIQIVKFIKPERSNHFD